MALPAALRRTLPGGSHSVAIGVEPQYRNSARHLVTSHPDTVAMIRQMLERTRDTEAAPPLVLRRGSRLPAALEIITESGQSRRAGRAVPRDLEWGYHRLVDDAGHDRLLVVSPGRCHLPDQLHGWGWAVQLYAARSKRSWGMGDIGDLGMLADWSAARDALFVLVNPLHAALPTAHQEECPYYPASRQFRNPLYLRIEDVPGADALGERLLVFAATGRALSKQPHIDRDAVWRLKQEALTEIWASDPPRHGFDEFRHDCGPSLTHYARFCVLTEHFGVGWHSWPERFRSPANAAVAEFAAANANRVDFHKWCQWLIAQQLTHAGRNLVLMHDLAIGVNPDGADCWIWGAGYASDYTVGAPPDRFNTLGQNWATPPFNPLALRAGDYRPFIEMVRAAFRGGGALRFDHVMGLFRLWWIPSGGHARDGAYVRYPWHDLLDILALESQRARAVVVGEDLGTVEAGVRPALRAANVLSYRLLIFGNGRRMESFPERAMTAVTTHDLPTIAGLWTGSDLADQQRLGLEPNVAGMQQMRSSVARLIGGDHGQPLDEVVVAVHRALAKAPSRLLAAALDDATLTRLRPNMPGTTAPTWPDWEIPLPEPLEAILASPVTDSVARLLQRGDTASHPTTGGSSADRGIGRASRVANPARQNALTQPP